jgi:hypothetical protein
MRNFIAASTLILWASLPAFGRGPPHPLADWPCDTPFAGPLEVGILWPGAAPAPEGAWRGDPVARHFVEFLTAAENSPSMGEREIVEFTTKNGPVKLETSRLIVSGMVERGNVLRRALLNGIKDQIIRSHVLAEAMAEQHASADAAAIKMTARQNIAALDDADDSAERLCHRLVYDETKLRRLVAALRAHTQ